MSKRPMPCYEIRDRSGEQAEGYRIVLWTMSTDRMNNWNCRTVKTFADRTSAERSLVAMARHRGAEIEKMGDRPWRFDEPDPAEQARREACGMWAALQSAVTDEDLDAIYLGWIGYSIFKDDVHATNERVRGDLKDYIREICCSTGVHVDDVFGPP